MLLADEEISPWTEELVAYYMERYSTAGDLVLDPFASQPALLRAAATSRRRLVLNHFSPAASLGLQFMASPPLPAALDAVFTRIADAPRRGRTLADRLTALYETFCPQCAQTCTATHYVWSRASGEPIEKAYVCPHCDSEGLVPVDRADLELSAGLEIRGAAYWGLLSRLVAPGDAQTGEARSLIELYTPRALNAISELITAVEQRLEGQAEQDLGRVLVLYVLRRCISLCQPPGQTAARSPGSDGERLRPPPRFIEYNVWLAFQEAYELLRSQSPGQAPLVASLAGLLAADGQGSAWLPCLPLQDLVQRLQPGSIRLILSDPPLFDPGMYALSFLWSGWLFGRSEAARLKQMLALRGATWDWYARVMTVALRSLVPLLAPGGVVVLAFSDRSSQRLQALMVAAAQAGLWPVAQSYQLPMVAEDVSPAWRMVLQVAASREPGAPVDVEHAARLAAQDVAKAVIQERGEPGPWSMLHTNFAVRWAQLDVLAASADDPQVSRRPVSYLLEQSRLACSPEMPLPDLRFYPAGKGTHLDQWAPRRPPGQLPLADRVEQHVAQLLWQGVATFSEIQQSVYGAFPGWLTPDAALVAACVDSYAQEVDGSLVLRAEDDLQRRAGEGSEILRQLQDLGHRLGYGVWLSSQGQSGTIGLVSMPLPGKGKTADWEPVSVAWHREGRPAYVFAMAIQAVLYPWLVPPPETLQGCPAYVVLPGGRAGLLDFKLRRCPAWRDCLAETGWEFVKFRHLRRLAAQPDLTLAGFRARIALDPVVALPGAQLTLFDEHAGA
jgi:hypothetical protein